MGAGRLAAIPAVWLLAAVAAYVLAKHGGGHAITDITAVIAVPALFFGACRAIGIGWQHGFWRLAAALAAASPAIAFAAFLAITAAYWNVFPPDLSPYPRPDPPIWSVAAAAGYIFAIGAGAVALSHALQIQRAPLSPGLALCALAGGAGLVAAGSIAADLVLDLF